MPAGLTKRIYKKRYKAALTEGKHVCVDSGERRGADVSCSDSGGVCVAHDALRKVSGRKINIQQADVVGGGER